MESPPALDYLSVVHRALHLLLGNRVRTLLRLVALCFPLVAGAQQPAAPAGAPRPLGPFAEQKLALMPVQSWRADTVGWSTSVNWALTRTALDSALQAVLLDRGLGRKWAYAADVVRSAKRNPIYATDPYALGVSRLRGELPKAGDPLPVVVADNLRPLTALGDTRYALIPVELKAVGDQVMLRIIVADTRSRTMIWIGDMPALGGAKMVEHVATQFADLVIDP